MKSSNTDRRSRPNHARPSGRRSPVVLLDADERALLSSVERGEWLAVGHSSTARSRYAQIADAPAMVRATAKKALARCPKKAGRQMGLLCTLVGDVAGAASLLSKASGLGWSDPDHPGHTVFPLLAMLLSKGAIGDALTAELDASARDVLESAVLADNECRPTLRTPSARAFVRAVRSSLTVSAADADTAIKAMRTAAEKRVEGILGNSRRRHYGHAA